MLLAAEVTVLLIEHDIGLVMNLSDHCVECSTEWSNPCGGSDGFGAVADKFQRQLNDGRLDVMAPASWPACPSQPRASQ